jgi:Fe-S cluster biogenesis protein NfuA
VWGENNGMSDRITQLPSVINELINQLQAARDRETSRCALDLVQALMEFHASGINRMMEIVDEQCGWQVIEKLGNDSLVSSMLLVHDLHPIALETRVAVALEKVRPLLRSHGGDVELVKIEGRQLTLRLIGACDGCSASSITIKTAIEQSISETAPDITWIEVVGGIHEADSKATVQLVSETQAQTNNCAA